MLVLDTFGNTIFVLCSLDQGQNHVSSLLCQSNTNCFFLCKTLFLRHRNDFILVAQPIFRRCDNEFMIAFLAFLA